MKERILSIKNKVKTFIFSNQGLVLVVGIFVIVACIHLAKPYINSSEKVVEPNTSETKLSSPLTIEGPVLEKSAPVMLRIPEVSIETSFVEPLGLEENGEVAVPDSYTEVGWYKFSPTPGEVGPAVILGHVDSSTGPAVFYSLGQLKVGDDIFIDREDGTTAHFKVEELERPSQSNFPTEKVYGNINYAGLRLITCTGIYDRIKKRYTNNLVVYARLVGENELVVRE